MVYHDIDIPKDALAAFCQKHRIRKLSLFGSILRDDFGPDSDIDVLVEFEPDARIGVGQVRTQDGHRVVVTCAAQREQHAEADVGFFVNRVAQDVVAVDGSGERADRRGSDERIGVSDGVAQGAVVARRV